jgi:hypothetical protein
MSDSGRPPKVCVRCGQTKPLDEFPGDRSRDDGRYPYCLDCHAAQSRPSTRVRHAAIRALIDLHRDDYESLLAAAWRGELTKEPS